MYKTALFIIGIIGILVCSCTAPNNDEYDPDKSKTNRFKGNPLLKPYFYPLESVPKIYIYRDKINGLLEQFHRVYTLTDNEGEHLIVERYNMKGELYEALNINTDSLNVMDQMIVNQKGEKTKAILYKGDIFPVREKQASVFKSEWIWNDTTSVHRTVKRTLLKSNALMEVLGKKIPSMHFQDDMEFTYHNAITKDRKLFIEKQKTVYAKGIGLVEWEGTNNKVHFRLERIISQEEWINMFKR